MRRRLTFLSAFFVLALLIGGTASAQQRFLVRMDLIDPGPLLSPQDVVGLLEGLVIPSLTSLAEMDKQGVLVGGLEAGGRNGFFIVEAESNHALSNMLANLPFWGIVRWHTTRWRVLRRGLGSPAVTLSTLVAESNCRRDSTGLRASDEISCQDGFN